MATKAAKTVDKALITKLYAEGKTYKDIGARCGCSMGVIADTIKAAGLPPRGHGGPAPMRPEGSVRRLAAPLVAAQPAPAPKAPEPPKAPPVAPRAATVRDPRLPAVGSTIHKVARDGTVRASCKVVADGIEYAGKVYPSLSAAAMAALRDLKLTAVSVNGFVWWGLV